MKRFLFSLSFAAIAAFADDKKPEPTPPSTPPARTRPAAPPGQPGRIRTAAGRVVVVAPRFWWPGLAMQAGVAAGTAATRPLTNWLDESFDDSAAPQQSNEELYGPLPQAIGRLTSRNRPRRRRRNRSRGKFFR